MIGTAPMKAGSLAKKVITWLLLAFAILFSLASCGGNSGTQSGDFPAPAPDIPNELACSECETGSYTVTTLTKAGPLTEGEELYACDSCSNSYTKIIEATRAIKVLFIGDASYINEISYLDELLLESGIKNYVIATLNHSHNTGASIESQWNNIQTNKKTYTYSKNVNGETGYSYSQTMNAGLTDEAWDVVCIGQSIPLGGTAASYSRVSEVAAHIKATLPDARLLWRMGWALRSDSSNSAFAEHENDQIRMYSDIVAVTASFIETEGSFDGIVATGTAVQSLRSTVLGDSWTDNGILLGGDSGDGAAYAASLLWAGELLGLEISELDWMPAGANSRDRGLYATAKEAAEMAAESKFEVGSPKVKSMKLLMMGNSYGNDAMAYFEKLLHDAGYVHVVIGHMGESSMAINDHYHNIDDDPTNDYIYKSTGNTFSVHYKMVNGVRVELEADYKAIVANEDWDIITFYQGPNSMDTLVKKSYYSELYNLTAAIRANMTNPDGRIIYYMPWIHGESNTLGYYNELSALTQELFLNDENIDGIIAAGTLIQNLRTSYLDSSASNTNPGDINRDWGHLNYGVGRYAVGLLFYAYLTGGELDAVSYIPTKEEITSRPFTPVEENLEVIRECVTNALEKPFEVTRSAYTEKP